MSPPEHEPDVAAAIVEQDALEREQALALSVLSTLRPKDREIIELCVLHGLSPAAIAAEIGVSASTLRNRLARALTRARRAYRAANLQQSNQDREVAE
jgi:RNA polymerase sigma-70 factor (ECF subfamily)